MFSRFHAVCRCLNFQVRNLKWLGFRVPLAIVNKAHQANQLYPFAISLIESVRTYERTCEKVRHEGGFEKVIFSHECKYEEGLVVDGFTYVVTHYFFCAVDHYKTVTKTYGFIFAHHAFIMLFLLCL